MGERSERRRLWVIDPSVNHPEPQGIRRVLGDWRGASRLFQPGLRPGDGPSPSDGYGVDGVVLMGSAKSAHDDLPWIRDLAAWLTPILDGTQPVPLLAICFGHQIVAHLAGADVTFLRPDRVKELGIRETRLSGGRLLPDDHRLRVVASHSEVVTSLPAGYRATAARERVPLDGLEHEHLPIFTFQFHPEAGEEFARHVGLDPSTVDARVIADGDRLLAAFRQVAAGRGWDSMERPIRRSG